MIYNHSTAHNTRSSRSSRRRGGGRSRRSRRRPELVANSHERDAEPIPATPVVGIQGTGIVGGETDAPSLVSRSRFADGAITRRQQYFFQLLVLRELFQVAPKDGLVTVLIPCGLVKGLDLTAQGLVLAWLGRSHDLGERLVVLEQLRLGCHHVLLGGAVGHAIDDELALVELREWPMVKQVHGRRLDGLDLVFFAFLCCILL